MARNYAQNLAPCQSIRGKQSMNRCLSTGC
ncbi:MAG: hypothetical protein ACI841_000426 [Planctomycetota bacterium]